MKRIDRPADPATPAKRFDMHVIRIAEEGAPKGHMELESPTKAGLAILILTSERGHSCPQQRGSVRQASRFAAIAADKKCPRSVKMRITGAGHGKSSRPEKVAVRNSIVRRATKPQSQVPDIQLRLHPVAPSRMGGGSCQNRDLPRRRALSKSRSNRISARFWSAPALWRFVARYKIHGVIATFVRHVQPQLFKPLSSCFVLLKN
jgi:hypothetical protein